MIECPKLSKCPFFNDKMANKPATAELMKNNFCRSDYKICARYMVLTQVGPDFVPADLFPSMKDRALEIIKKKK